MALQWKAITTITLSGSAQKISTASIPNVVAIVFQCPAANAGTTVVETQNASLATTSGVGILAGKELSIGGSQRVSDTETFDLSDFYVKGTNNDTLRISYLLRS